MYVGLFQPWKVSHILCMYSMTPHKYATVLPQAGRSSKRQLFLFPGGIERHVKIKTCSVSVHPLLAVHDPCSARTWEKLWWTYYLCWQCHVFQVALEVIEELCYEMGLHRLDAMEEYAVFLVTNRGVATDVLFSESHIRLHLKLCTYAWRQVSLLLVVKQIHIEINVISLSFKM